MTAFVLRSYQQEALDHAKVRNTIANLPTGFGKTFIAVKLIDYHLFKRYPTKRVAFLVPTRPLVVQQSKYCYEHCRLPCGSSPVIQKLVGQDQANWIQSDWDKCMRTSHILLGTAALFQQAFVTDRNVDIGSFSLIVFDECHNACGNSPMAALMRDGVVPYQAKGLTAPRILGLTASFINGNLRNMQQKRRDLEALLLSTIICPDVPKKLADDKFKMVSWTKKNNNDEHMRVIEKHVEDAVKHVGEIKELSKVITRCIHVFEELGADALIFYIEKVIIKQIVAKASMLEEQGKAKTICYARQIKTGLPGLQAQLDVLLRDLLADPLVQQAAKRSLKVDRLVDLMNEIYVEKGSQFRGIVFVEQVALVSSLAMLLNRSLVTLRIHCGAVAGTGYQSEGDRQSQLDKFRTGEIRILVATATLEEGIDVSECAFVVRFTYVATTKAHIQGAGRARHPNATIYYFENNPRVERQKEAALTATAKDSSLSLTANELHKAVGLLNMPFDQRHPYPFLGRGVSRRDASGEVNVYNCKQIFNQFCSITLGTSVQPKKLLYQYRHKPGEQKSLSRVRYPTPNGWRSLCYSDYQSFWGEADMEKVFASDRVKRKTSSEKEEMCFVYMVVVLLREKGYLDDHNRPYSSIRSDIKRECPLTASWSSAISVRNTVFQSY